MPRQSRSFLQQVGNNLSVISCGLVLIITWSTVLINRHNERQDVISSATHETTNLANAISGYLQQILGSFDQILVAARFTGLTPGSRPVLKSMAEVSGLAGTIRSLSLYDAAGDLVASTVPGPLAVNIADRSWFQNFRDHPEDQLFIGPPIVSRTTNQLALILARGIRDDQGRFQGMVGMSISPEYFAAFFRNLPLGEYGVINLIGRDGIIYVRVTSKDTTYGQPITTAGLRTIVEQAKDTPSGTRYVGADASIDHTAKYFSFQAFSAYPLIVNVGVAENEILEGFRTETWKILVASTLFSGALIAATIVGQRRMNIIRRQAEALHDQARSLQTRNQELAEQSLALAGATRAAQEADQLKGEFIANMSHELRTPLNAIIGFSAVLLDSTDETANPRSRTNLEHINAAGRHLLDLVTGVLEIAKLESGSFEVTPEPVDLGELVEECIAMTEVLRTTKAIELAFAPPPACLATCDQTRTRQIVLNLLSNAIKFSPKGSRLAVRLSGGGPDRAVVEIADTGIGMTEDEIAIALTPFAQVSSGPAKSYDGTGLGLPLAKRLVEVQGGRFTLESVKDAGTFGRFDLPGQGGGIAAAPETA